MKKPPDPRPGGRLTVRQRRYRWWRQTPHCYWCGILTTFGNEGVEYRDGKLVHPGPETATVDHLYPRGHPLRTPGARVPKVIACMQCNQTRAHFEPLLDLLPPPVRTVL